MVKGNSKKDCLPEGLEQLLIDKINADYWGSMELVFQGGSVNIIKEVQTHKLDKDGKIMSPYKK